MKYYNIIFVVCTYGAVNDLKNFITSVNALNKNTKIIVSNSFCSEQTLHDLQKVARDNNCDFLDLPNKGYGYSLNEGIAYANMNYRYDYIAITNADILIKKFELSKSPREAFVLAPEIVTPTGKRQNPFYIYPYFKLFKLSKWMREKFHLKRTWIIIIVAKFHRTIFNFLFGKKKKCWKKIYAGHGAFIIFSRETLKRIERPFEDNIFLYCEENFIGYKMKKCGIPYYYTSDISVVHTEDGSGMFYTHKISDETQKSMRIYDELIKNE